MRSAALSTPGTYGRARVPAPWAGPIGAADEPDVPHRSRLDVPSGQVADAPIEHTGHRRSDVRLLVARSDRLEHRRFDELPGVLEPGDLLVVNVSATLPSAVPVRGDPDRLVHVSGVAPEGVHILELRRACGAGSVMDDAAFPGEELELPGGARVRLIAPFGGGGPRPSGRLWLADLRLPTATGSPPRDPAADPTDPTVVRWLHGVGRPIRYGCTASAWPLHAYQTVFASRPGSAEMPSAARPFTTDLLRRFLPHRIGIAPIVLHTGVSSLENGELPYPEWFSVPGRTARRVNRARAAGRRVVAVGTTAVRALESAAVGDQARPLSGWTDLVVTAERGVRVVDGLLTGWHEPEATHLDMLEAVAGADLVRASYAAAAAAGYRWHEFGDSHLLLP